MRHLFILLALVSVTFISQGQITWDQAVADTARGFETKSDIETHNVVTFTQPGTYRWVRTYKESCSIKTAICDKNSCYLETTDSADFTVAANESFDMICHFYPYNKCCPEGAMVSLYVYKVDDPSVNSTATYYLDLWCASLGVNSPENSGFTIAPNPVNDVIHLIDLPNQVSNISVVNILGEKVMDINNSVSSLNVAELEAGVYWIAVETDGVTLTNRFIKQ